MKILIVGAGRIGSSVAESLVSEANDITVVDQDAERSRDSTCAASWATPPARRC